jgi:hypothetical protein
LAPRPFVSLRTKRRQRQGAVDRHGTPQVLREITLSPQYLVGGGFFGIFRYLDHTSLRLPELALRLDLRRDRSSAPVFAGRRRAARFDIVGGHHVRRQP